MLIELLQKLALILSLPESWHNAFILLGSLTSCLLFICICFFLAKAYLRPLIAGIVNRFSKKRDILQYTTEATASLASNLSHLVPAFILLALTNVFFSSWPELAHGVNVFLWVYMLCFIGLSLASFIGLFTITWARLSENPTIPYQVFGQLMKLLIFIVTAILVISTLLGKSPVIILSGFGALTAVLMLVFQNSILGFVASIQMAANNMVSVGDWIEMPKYGADGDVIEITLTTVKIKNWDNTITTIPTHALIADSFKNWRGMQESGGRRIKRSINLDIHTIHFLTKEEADDLRKHPQLKKLLEQEHLQPLLASEQLTNAALYRAYIEWTLRSNEFINQNMTVMVRQLQPTEVGLPLEIYCFCSDKRWVYYESIQADLFDRLFAVLPVFKLAAFQRIGQKQQDLLSE